MWHQGPASVLGTLILIYVHLRTLFSIAISNGSRAVFFIFNQIACTLIIFFLKNLYCLFLKIWSDLHTSVFGLVGLALWLPVKFKKRQIRTTLMMLIVEFLHSALTLQNLYLVNCCHSFLHRGALPCAHWASVDGEIGSPVRGSSTTPSCSFCVGRWLPLWITLQCCTAREGSTKRPSRCVKEPWRSEKRCGPRNGAPCVEMRCFVPLKHFRF